MTTSANSQRSNSRIEIPYGNALVEGKITGVENLGALDVGDALAIPNLDQALREAFANPIGLDSGIFSRMKSGDTVAIIVPDSFRTTRIEQVLPALIDGILDAGVNETEITFTYATGTHRGPTPAEEEQILGAGIYARFKDQAFSHDPRETENLAFLGTTSRGTPVHINKRVHDSDHIIATGAAVFHYFGGYGGGRKSVTPGVAGLETIASNHSMNLHPTEDTINPAVRIGGIDGNPVAEDMLEATRFTHVGAIVNTVLNRRSEIARIFVGELEAAHVEAAAFASTQFRVDIDRRADLVIAASPSTQNFVQTHKALFNSYQAVKPEGRIILLTPCPEGPGGEQFVKWLRLGTREAIIAGLREESEINGQTALSTRQKAPITQFVTEMTAQECEFLGGRKAESLQGAIDIALAELAESGCAEPTYYTMPSAAYAVPFPPA